MRCRRSSRTDRTTTCVTSCDDMLPAVAAGAARRRGRRILRTHRLHARADRNDVRARAQSRTAGAPARGSTERWRRRRDSRRSTAPCRPIISNTHRTLRCERMARSRRRRRPAARRVLLPAREPACHRSSGCARCGIPMAVSTRLQSGHVADRIAPACDEHGVRAVPDDCRRSAARRDRERGTRARTGDDRGTLRAGMRADLAIWRLRHPEQLCAEVGAHRPVEDRCRSPASSADPKTTP